MFVLLLLLLATTSARTPGIRLRHRSIIATRRSPVQQGIHTWAVHVEREGDLAIVCDLLATHLYRGDVVKTRDICGAYLPENAFAIALHHRAAHWLATASPAAPYIDLIAPLFAEDKYDSPPAVERWNIVLAAPRGRLHVNATVERWRALGYSATPSRWRSVLVTGSFYKIKQLASDAHVLWIEPSPLPAHAAITAVPAAQSYAAGTPRASVWKAGFRGSGEIIGISDTGIDMGSVFFRQAEDGPGTPSQQHRKVRALIRYGWADAKDTANGHGTHVAGLAAGAALPSDTVAALYNGAAPSAQIVFADIQDAADGDYLAPPGDLGVLLRDLSSHGALISTHSWGSSTSFGYTAQALDVDEFLWEFPSSLAFFAAGNAGKIISPAVAKNCVTVGATHPVPSSGAAHLGWEHVQIVAKLRSSPAILQRFAGEWGTGPLNAPFADVAVGPLTLQSVADTSLCSGFVIPSSRFALIVEARTTCSDTARARNAKEAGATALLISRPSRSVTPHEGFFRDSVSLPTIGMTSEDASALLSLLSRYGQADLAISFEPLPIGLPDAGPRDLFAFSGKGPTADGRIKPEVVCVGETEAAHASPGDPLRHGLSAVSLKVGTSMATPIAAGSALLLREYFRTTHHLPSPSGMLLKAALIHSCAPLNAPPSSSGWGAVSLSTIINPAQKKRTWADDKHALPEGRGTYARYTVHVVTSGFFSVTMAYFDFPGTPAGGGSTLVNDLDLFFLSPYGWEIRGNNEVRGDSKNPTEHLSSRVTPGDYFLEVQGVSVLFGGVERYQPYSLFATMDDGISVGDVSGDAITVAGGNGAPRGDVDPLPIHGNSCGGKILPSLLPGVFLIIAWM